MTSPTIAAQNTQPGILHYLGLGLRGAALASVVNVAIYYLGRALFNLPFAIPMQTGAEPSPLPVIMVVVASTVPALLAAVVLYILNRLSRHGLRIFVALSVVLALLSLVGPLSLPIDGGTIAALSLMHFGAAAAIVGVLAMLSARSQRV